MGTVKKANSESKLRVDKENNFVSLVWEFSDYLRKLEVFVITNISDLEARVKTFEDSRTTCKEGWRELKGFRLDYLKRAKVL